MNKEETANRPEKTWLKLFTLGVYCVTMVCMWFIARNENRHKQHIHDIQKRHLRELELHGKPVTEAMLVDTCWKSVEVLPDERTPVCKPRSLCFRKDGICFLNGAKLTWSFSPGLLMLNNVESPLIPLRDGVLLLDVGGAVFVLVREKSVKTEDD